jgi:DNA-binding CsgD family transcriptional regulator/pimeloyl-ACP methyl ester carboxylesterase
MEPPPVQYVTTSDGFDIAYTVCGDGPPYVFMPNQANHVQLEWSSPIHMAWLEGLKERFTLICYDHRGQGMSTRGLPPDFKLTDFLTDLEAVVDHLGLERFVLDGETVYGHVAIQYAVAHPERVDALILKHSAVAQRFGEPALIELARNNWDHHRQLVSGYLPGDRDKNLAYLRQTGDPRDWITKAENVGVSDVTEFLPDLRVPTLILHARSFGGRKADDAAKLATKIAGSRLVVTDGSAAVIDAAQGLMAIDAFLQGLPPRAVKSAAIAPDGGLLSAREIEVLRLLSQGKSNQQIADELVISLNTVRRHVSNVFDKTGVANRTEASVYARDHGIS